MDLLRPRYIGVGKMVLTVRRKLSRPLSLGMDDLELNPSIGGTSKVPEERKEKSF